jgi:hypothetical protein
MTSAILPRKIASTPQCKKPNVEQQAAKAEAIVGRVQGRPKSLCSSCSAAVCFTVGVALAEARRGSP